jgi:hypothetical protein
VQNEQMNKWLLTDAPFSGHVDETFLGAVAFVGALCIGTQRILVAGFLFSTLVDI